MLRDLEHFEGSGLYRSRGIPAQGLFERCEKCPAMGGIPSRGLGAGKQVHGAFDRR